MQNHTLLRFPSLCGLLLSALALASQAQTSAIWTGPASGGEWNTPADWSTGMAPLDSTTNAFIGVGTNVSYNLPMTAASFGILTNNGVLNINTNGFNCSAIYMVTPSGSKLNLTNSGTVVTLSGGLNMGTNSSGTLGLGASLTVQNLALGFNTGNGTFTSSFTNNGGTLTALNTTLNNSGGSTIAAQLVINGGTNNLGTTTVGRAHNSSVYTLGQEGLVVYGGLVNTTNLTVTGPSFGSAYVAGGIVTNYGNITIAGTTAGRYLRVVQAGGLLVAADPSIVYLSSTTPGTETARYQVTGGTNFIGGIYIGNSNSLNAATMTVTVGGTVYIGSQGIATNGSVNNTFTLTSGGVFGATANWDGSVPMNLNGATAGFTYQAADPNGVAYNITNDAVLTGGGQAAFVYKTGAGTLTMNAANTYAGTTLIKAGTLALGANGSLASSPILVGSGATFDVSSIAGGYNAPAGQTLSGLGTINGAVTLAGATINPGSNTLNGTLTFSSSVSETGSATNHFDLIGTSGASNDLMVVNGDFDLSGANYVEINGGSFGVTYPLIQYDGVFNGNVAANLILVGTPGILSNDVVSKTIYLISQNTSRLPTGIVWVGNSVTNNWDLTDITNWLVSGQLNYFMNADSVLFGDAGAANSAVNVAAIVTPAATTVNSGANYSFAGSGAIAGSGALTKSGAGTLNLNLTNTYTGATLVTGGVLEVPWLVDGGTASPIGASVSDPTTWLLTNSTLQYDGSTVAIDRAATLGGTVAVVVTNSGTTLTISGSLIGNAALTLSGSGGLTLSGANSYTGGTLLNNGTLTLNNATAAGSGPISFQGNSTLAIGAVVPGNTIIISNYNGLITGGSGSGLTGINDVLGNSNLVLAVTSGVFDLKGNLGAYTGNITFSNAGGAVVRFNGSIGSPLATWNLGSGPMDLNIRTSSSSNNIGALQGSVGTTLSGRGGSSNNGPTTHYIGANGLNTLFDGVIQDGAGGSASTTSINKVGTGTLALTGSSTYTGNTTISSGTLALTNNPATSNDGSINNSATINITTGAILDVTGRSDGTLQLGGSASQTLAGRGILKGSLSVQGSGTVAPGNGLEGGVGVLTVTNAINLGGTAWMKLSRGSSPNSDRLISSLSTITYGGTLILTNVGAPLQVGDTFTLFSGAGLAAASFSSIVQPDYASFDLSQLGVNGSITLTNTFQPAIGTVDFSSLLNNGSIILNVTNGAVNGPVNILTATNLAGPWVINTSAVFDGSGNLSQTITVDQTQSALFIRLQAQ